MTVILLHEVGDKEKEKEELPFWGSPGMSSLEASQGQETAREDQGRSGKPREVKVIFHHLPEMEDDLKFLTLELSWDW